ncbi:MAG: AmmeMemoRadiSam system protein B [Gammaproteobacteria bacterium]|nr:AmmeMemoRadiSam system protein B [Gammaproteobacteria bacterium]
MSNIRQPAVAGLFYPEDPATLQQQVEGFLNRAPKPEGMTWPKAIIAPHAGYIYSGPTAGYAYETLTPGHALIKRVILLAPAHRYPIRGLAYASADYFRTPLGDIPADHQALSLISGLIQVNSLDQAFNGEHALEVHLPFLQEILDEFTLVPLLVGDTDTEEVSQVLEKLWGGEETVIVISSDLSHFYDYSTAQTLDAEATRAIEALDPTALKEEHACGRIPIRGLLMAARNHHLTATTLSLKNSGDTAGSKDRVVGYGSYAFQ